MLTGLVRLRWMRPQPLQRPESPPSHLSVTSLRTGLIIQERTTIAAAVGCLGMTAQGRIAPYRTAHGIVYVVAQALQTSS
jgi:hypothetical protein